MTTLNELKQLPLAEFILHGNFGYKKCKSSTKKTTVLRNNAGERLLVYNAPRPSGHYIFADANSSLKGTIIDFLKHHNLDFKDYLNLPLVTKKPQKMKDKPVFKEEEQQGIEHHDVLRKIYSFPKLYPNNYLIQRGIKFSEGILKGICHEIVYNEKQVVFPLSSAKRGLYEGYFIKNGPKNDPKYPKQIVGKGSIKGLFLFGGNSFDARHFVLCESPIDALSVAYLIYKKYGAVRLINTCFCALCGAPGKAAKEFLLRYLNAICDLEYIYLCFDNDNAGDNYTSFFRKYLAVFKTRKKVTIKDARPPSQFKDWNDKLNAPSVILH